ncbi:MAG: hypothetical protein RJA98_4087 [Pseudomonadota bacterium]
MSAPLVLAAAPPGPGDELALADQLTVMCVDDEPNILAALKRTLRGRGYAVLTACSGAEALETLAHVPVDLLISDMRMPGMDGTQLLEQVNARWPHTVRLLLTGHADMDATIGAINRGQIFRYIHKPWDEGDLLSAVAQGLERLALQRDKTRLEALTQAQNRSLQQLNGELETRVQARTAELQTANDKLRRNHLKTIKVFSNLLELRGGGFAGHGRRVAEMARNIARHMGLPEAQVLPIFVAGLLHDIGLIGAADTLLSKPVSKLSKDELALYRQHPANAEQSLMALDDLQNVVPLIHSHHEHFDGSGFPQHLAGADIPLGGRILAVADAFDELQTGQVIEQAVTAAEARTLIFAGSGRQFDPAVLLAFMAITEPERPKVARPDLILGTTALQPDMVVARDLVSARGMLMLTAGHRLTPSLIQRLQEFDLRDGGTLKVHIQAQALV